jgi:acid stress chaperone HdeB
VNPKLVVSVVIIVACSTTNAQAQVTIDASKITCEQFAHSKVASVRSVAIWLSGYYAGKQGNPVIDSKGFEEKSVKLERFCQREQNFKLPVMQAVEQVLGKK